jgi:photosystem II stability/assembly factor-like uncharacterized protein
VIKSTDGGTTWNASNTGFTTPWLARIVPDPRNQGVIYAAFREYGSTRGIWKSTNGGANWSAINTGITDTSLGFYVFAISPGDSNVLYTIGTKFPATTISFYRSTDAGASWSPVSHDIPPANYVGTITIDPWRHTRFFMVHPTAGFMVSENEGAHWSTLNEGAQVGAYIPASRGIWVDPFEPTLLYASVSSYGLFKRLRSSY